MITKRRDASTIIVLTIATTLLSPTYKAVGDTITDQTYFPTNHQGSLAITRFQSAAQTFTVGVEGILERLSLIVHHQGCFGSEDLNVDLVNRPG